jgi:hypothetical protein
MLRIIWESSKWWQSKAAMDFLLGSRSNKDLSGISGRPKQSRHLEVFGFRMFTISLKTVKITQKSWAEAISDMKRSTMEMKYLSQSQVYNEDSMNFYWEDDYRSVEKLQLRTWFLAPCDVTFAAHWVVKIVTKTVSTVLSIQCNREFTITSHVFLGDFSIGRLFDN